MPNETIIRPYEQSDYQVVKAKLEKANLFYEPMDSEQMYSRLLQDGNMILVAELDGRVVGSILVLKSWGPFLFRLVVDDELRGQWIGTKLLETAEERVKAQGDPEVHILVDEGDEELQAFYEKRGYEKGGVYRWMAKTLPLSDSR